MLTAVFSYMIVLLTKINIKHVKAGLDDELIREEFDPKNKKKESKVKRAFNITINVLFYSVLIFIFYKYYANTQKNLYL